MYSFQQVLLTTVVVSGLIMCSVVKLRESDEYLKEREQLLKSEEALFIGENLFLTAKEKEVNNLLLNTKLAEFSKAHNNISDFFPSDHFFKSKDRIDESEVFSFIKEVPKGASLHTHLLAAASVDFLVENITYRENIYGCFLNGVFKLRFLESTDQDSRCVWKELKEYRKEDPNFDIWLRRQLSLEVKHPHHAYPSVDIVWTRFKKIFTTVYDMLSYKPVFEDYIYQVLKELYIDNVMYAEFRGTFMPLYELNGFVYSNKNFFKIFIDAVNNFKKDYPAFIGVKYIHSIYRGVTSEVLQSGLDELIQLQKLYPDFIAGFDFVGYEEEGKRLVDFHKELMQVSEYLKFYFHAGETNWYGSTDLNIADAILLNTTRIGHGFTLPKHPKLMKLVKDKNIPIELCPISNQVLMLNEDPRNHPATVLMANGINVVICNDDPSIWGATGLSYDWYIVFMAMTPENSGIEVLKQFALNSINYSSMGDEEKSIILSKWTLEWEKFLDKILKINVNKVSKLLNL